MKSTQQSQVTSLIHDLKLNFIFLVLALLLGLSIQFFHKNPLSWSYQTPQQRLMIQAQNLKKNQIINHIQHQEFIPLPAQIELDALMKYWDENRIILIDARPSAVYELGHIPKAFNLPRETFDQQITQFQKQYPIPLQSPIVVYCAGITCKDAEMVISALRVMGYTNLSLYTGGWDEWTLAGLETTKTITIPSK